MKTNIQIRKFDPAKLDELISFSLQHPWKPAWPENLQRRFLTELVSGSHLVMDIFSGERIAVAVLVDKITNKGRNAALEVLGFNYGDSTAVFEMIIRRAQSILPSSTSGIELSVHDSHAFLHKIAEQLGFKPYYETFEMLIKGLDKMRLATPENIEFSSERDDHELYSVLTKAFQENVDTSIPDFQSWKTNRHRANDSTTYLFRKNGRILGFLNLILPVNKTPEIRTLGVLPEARGKGIGKNLILRSLADLANGGHLQCTLTVAVQNQNALHLYRSLGFEQTDHFTVYCWKTSNWR